MKLYFYGGAGSVSGANYVLETGAERIMVDCGLFQGRRYATPENFIPFPYAPKDITAVLITHAHIDHIGRLPKLIAEGFRGKVYSTPPTKAFAHELLADSQDILSREAAACGAESFCAPKHLEHLLKQWETVPYHERVQLNGTGATFFDAGHILGSAFVKVEAEGKSVVFSGDLGNSPAPLIKEREPLAAADYCLVESTYGDRVHEPRGRVMDQLEDVVEDVVRREGTLLVPAFSLERTQALLYHLQNLMASRRIPEMPIFLDSPLAIRLTELYLRFRDDLDDETRAFVDAGNTLFDFPMLKRTETHEESLAIWKTPSPKIVIAGAGMSHGGRIVNHEKHYLPDPRTVLLLVSFQAEGSLGRTLAEGAAEVVINDERVPVKATVRCLPAYSAHADQPQLISWLRPARFSLKQVFIVQGELHSMRVLAEKVRDELAVQATVPKAGEVAEL